MFRKYLNANLTKNKVVQISNNTVSNLPLATAGLNIQETINYSGTFKKYHIANLDNYILIFLGNNIFVYNALTKQKEQTVILDNNIVEVKTAKITENKLIICYSVGGFTRGGEVRCKILSVNNKILSLSKLKSITSHVSFSLACCCLDSDTIIISYFTKKDMFDKDVFPRISLLKLKNDTLDLVNTYTYDKKDFNENLDEVEITLTRLSENEFIHTYFYNYRSNCKAQSNIFCVDSQLNINKHKENFSFNGKQTGAKRIKSIVNLQNISNNKILYYDSKASCLYFKEITKINDDYNTKTLSALNVYNCSKIFLINKQNNLLKFALISDRELNVIILNTDNNALLLEKRFVVDIDFTEFKFCNYNNNLFSLNKNNFSILNFSTEQGNILGIATDKETVVLEGVAKLSDIELELGKSYYFDKNGALTTEKEGNNYIGYAISTDTIIVFPKLMQVKTISKKYDGQFKANTVIKQRSTILGLHVGNGKVVIQGFAKLTDIELNIGSKYYYTAVNGSISTNKNNKLLGIAISKNTLFIPKYLS